MQLPSTDELVLVSGLLPIRAKKLRYYEDRNFIERILPAPELSEEGYKDKPAQRRDDWTGQVRGTDNRLMLDDKDQQNVSVADDGGLQQQRHPGLPEEMTPHIKEPVQRDLFNRDDDENDSAADKRMIDMLPAAARVYGVDQGMDRERDDLLPGID
jgi:type IV secretion system protein VirD4